MSGHEPGGTRLLDESRHVSSPPFRIYPTTVTSGIKIDLVGLSSVLPRRSGTYVVSPGVFAVNPLPDLNVVG